MSSLLQKAVPAFHAFGHEETSVADSEEVSFASPSDYSLVSPIEFVSSCDASVCSPLSDMCSPRSSRPVSQVGGEMGYLLRGGEMGGSQGESQSGSQGGSQGESQGGSQGGSQGESQGGSQGESQMLRENEEADRNEGVVKRDADSTKGDAHAMKGDTQPIQDNNHTTNITKQNNTPPHHTFSQDTILTLFGNIDQLLLLSQDLLSDLRAIPAQHKDEVKTLAQMVLSRKDAFQAFNDYIAHLPAALDLLSACQSIKSFTYCCSVILPHRPHSQSVQSRAEMHGLSLYTGLLLPLSQITTYEMLFGNICLRLKRSIDPSVNETYRFIRSLNDKASFSLRPHSQVHCCLPTLSPMPPIDVAVSMSLPLPILWPEPCRYYGGFDVLIGYRKEIEEIGTVVGMRGRLFLFDLVCFFAIPSRLRRSGQYMVIFQFMIKQLGLEHSTLEPERLLILSVPDDGAIEEFAIVFVFSSQFMRRFDSPSDRMACENSLSMIQRAARAGQGGGASGLQLGSKIDESSRIVLDDDLEQAMNPQHSKFASLNDPMAMQRYERRVPFIPDGPSIESFCRPRRRTFATSPSFEMSSRRPSTRHSRSDATFWRSRRSKSCSATTRRFSRSFPFSPLI